MTRREKLIDRLRNSPGSVRFSAMAALPRHEGFDPAYSVTFPDIPGIITRGDSLPEAFANACEALDLRLESLQKLGQPAPAIRHRWVLEAA